VSYTVARPFSGHYHPTKRKLGQHGPAITEESLVLSRCEQKQQQQQAAAEAAAKRALFINSGVGESYFRRNRSSK